MACCCCRARPCENPCPPTLPCSPCCCYRCCRPCVCPRPCCPPPCPCTPCPPCRCSPPACVCKPPVNDDYVGPVIPVLPPTRPPRLLPRECQRPPDPCPCFLPVLPCLPPPEPCPPPPVMPCCEPIVCVPPVLPCPKPQCPPPCLPKQRPICPRAPRVLPPCIPLERTCCCQCEPDAITRRRPLIVWNSVMDKRPTGLPAQCYERNDPACRFTINEWYQMSNCAKNVCVPLCC